MLQWLLLYLPRVLLPSLPFFHLRVGSCGDYGQILINFGQESRQYLTPQIVLVFEQGFSHNNVI